MEESINLNRIHIGDIIAARRKELGHTVRGLAELSGVPYQSISRIEHGQYNASIDIVSKILDIINLKIEITLKSPKGRDTAVCRHPVP